MTIDFDKLYPWKGIETVTIDDQMMVKIPKFYLKVGTAPTGTAQAGKKCWWVSASPRTGYHLHPAFMRNGVEKDCFYIGAYEAYNAGSNIAGSAAGKSPRVSITFNQAQAACLARNNDSTVKGFHLYNYYERCAVAILCMIEQGTPDVQSSVGSGNSSSSAAVTTGSSTAVWRGIHEFWGNVWEWCDGLKTANDGTTVFIFDNEGYGEYVNTGVTIPAGSGLGIQAVSEAEGERFDLKDVFVPSTVSGTAAAATFRDGYSNATGAQHNLFVSGVWEGGAAVGLFTFRSDNAPSLSDAGLGFRLAKYDD